MAVETLLAAHGKLTYQILLSYLIIMLLGKEVSTKQMDLRRVADVAIDLFAMTAVLSRCSRSYCIGLRNAEHEVLFTN